MSARSILLLLPAALWLSATSAEPLRTVAEVRALSKEQAARLPPARIEGVITFHDSALKRTFVQDETGGIFALVEPGDDDVPLPVGTRVEVSGVAFPGQFATHLRGVGHRDSGPYYSSVSIRVLGEGQWPAAVGLTASNLMHPGHHCSAVQVEGAVRGIRLEGPRARLDVSCGGRAFEAIVSGIEGKEAALQALVYHDVRLRGVYLALFRDSGQMQGFEIYVPAPSFIEAVSRTRGGFFDAPESAVPDLLRFSTQRSERVRVRGVVSLALPGEGLFLQTARGSLWVATNQLVELRPGSHVDVAGISSIGPQQQPLLEDGVVRVLGEAGPPLEARPISAGAVRIEHDGELLAVEGRLGLIFAREGRRTFVIEADGAEFVAAESEPGLWKAPPRNSWVRATGVCRVSSASQPDASPRGFRLLLRDSADLAVLRAPAWHESEIVLWALGAAVLLGCATLAWNLTLRRRVAQQTAIITAKVERERVAAERERIARDLHDSLQQELAGLGLQLEAVQRTVARTHAGTETSSTLELARAMLRRTQAETRRAVWDLGPEELTGSHLGETLAARLHPLNRPGGMQIDVRWSGTPRRFPGVTETQILRVAQEAVGNALQHSKASRIDVRLDFCPSEIALQILDDGVGFDPASAYDGPPQAAFGLHSMRNRARRLRAEFSVRSKPGEGTLVALRLAA